MIRLWLHGEIVSRLGGHGLRLQVGVYESNKAVEPRVLRFMDHAHATAAELLYDAIVRNSLAD